MGFLIRMKTPPHKMNISQTLPMASRKPSTSSDALTINKNEEENTVSTVRIPYIILNSNTVEDDKADKVMIEAMVDNALISTQSEAEAL